MPLVFDLGGVATEPKTALTYVRKDTIELKRDVKPAMDVSTNFRLPIKH